MEKWSTRLGVVLEKDKSLNIDELFEKKGFVTASFENLINWARSGSLWPMTFGLASVSYTHLTLPTKVRV